jgi:hypothetical protein
MCKLTFPTMVHSIKSWRKISPSAVVLTWQNQKPPIASEQWSDSPGGVWRRIRFHAMAYGAESDPPWRHMAQNIHSPRWHTAQNQIPRGCTWHIIRFPGITTAGNRENLDTIFIRIGSGFRSWNRGPIAHFWRWKTRARKSCATVSLMLCMYIIGLRLSDVILSIVILNESCNTPPSTPRVVWLAPK